MMAGPCAIESRESIFKIAEEVKKAGAQILRGGALNQELLLMIFKD